MKLSGDWIEEEGTQRILRLLNDAGHQAYVVGGCVRNAILGVPIADVDMATDARPRRVAELARQAGLKVVPTGIEHGTVTVIHDGIAHEVTTFRRDVATDGRRAVVAFSDRIEDDAARRDFTMNALYADADGQVIDPLGGLPDLLARRVRFVGDPEARIREDYLRILRFFRFHAHNGDPRSGMDPEALAACAANADGIARLSRERIGHEMRRLLDAPDPAPALAGMENAGVLHRILPGATSRFVAPLVHLEPPYAPDWRRRLAALGGSDEEEALRLSRAEARHLHGLKSAVESGAGPAELAYRHGAQIARDALLLRAAMTGAPMPAGWEEEVARGASAVFPLRAADLMPRYQGAELGARLKEAEERWIRSGFSLSREQLLA